MRNFAVKTRRRGTWQSWAARGGLALAILAIAWALNPSPATATDFSSAHRDAPADSGGRSTTARIQGLEIREGAPGMQLEVATTGVPIWTTYRDSEGDLVVELSNTLPVDSVVALTPAQGLIRAVDIQVEQNSEHPLTRLVIRTRTETEHSVTAAGTSLRIDLVPVATAEAAEWQIEPVPDSAVHEEVPEEVAEEVAAKVEVTTVDEPATAPVEPVPGPSGEPAGSVVASQLEDVEIDAVGGKTVIRIVGDGEFHYSTLTLGAPDRFVVDLIGVVNMAPNSSIPVENGLVERVRIAQYKPYPEPVSRVVIDLRNSSAAQVLVQRDGLAVSFEGGTVAEQVVENVEIAESIETLDDVADRPVVDEAPEPETEEAETVVAEVELAEPATAGMGADEAGSVGSHELSSLASAVASDALEEELEPETIELAPEPVAVEQPVIQVAEVRPEPIAYSAPQEEPQASAESPVPAFQSQPVGQVEKTYQGEPMTISLKDGDIKDVLRSFAQISGLNVVVQPGVSGTVTVELTDVPWDQALEIILKTNGLGYELEGNIMRVAPIGQLRAEAEEQQRLVAAQALSIPLSTMMKRISYAAAGEVAGILKAGGGASIMSARGSVVVDRRTNTLIIKELPSYIDSVMAVIENLDVPEPQVMIEARIIETTKAFSSTLGIEWGFLGISSAEYGNTTGLVFPNNGTVEGGVNLLTGGSNGFLDITLGNILNSFTLDMTLQAAENEGLINILSAPKITTLNNEQASIQSGLQIPIQTVANNTVSVQFVNATLRLDVTPHVTAEGTVLMDISIQKREPVLAFAVAGATNAPIATKDARTRVIVRDGGTTVIGGIYKVSTDRGEDRVPGLANVPIVGHLFKNKRQNDQNEELLIFITPRVIKL